MKALTNNDYYNVLLEACKEAYEVIELKEFHYSKESMNENKEIIVSKEAIERLGIEKTNNQIVNYRIENEMESVFFSYLERQQLRFEKKYFIQSNEFYKKCLNTINIKLTEMRKKDFRYKISRNIDVIENQPEPILYLQNMKWRIKERAVKEIQARKEQTPQQQFNSKEIEQKKELHNHIFIGNSFEIWQSMFADFNVKETSRTDLRFMYEIMKQNKLIHKTITLKSMSDWINDTYQITVGKLPFTNIKAKSNKKRLVIYNRITSK